MPDTRTVKKIEGIVMRYVDRLLASSIPIAVYTDFISEFQLIHDTSWQRQW